ncbi:MAG: SpoIID/LytB domain-containing protein, partial [Armatimonadota bacterium]|nr:SpoIID/LytB domain-containing protein [Armatimonadota bacterium]
HSEAGFDLCDSTHCQTYCGASREAEWVRRAVDETKDLIISFEDKPILANYMADCGGATMNSEDFRSGAVPIPYLRSVIDNPSGILSPINPPATVENNGAVNDNKTDSAASNSGNIVSSDYCANSPHHLWAITYTIDELANKLSSWQEKTGKLQSIEFAEFDQSGRVKAVLLKGEKGEFVIHGIELRNALGHDKMKSTRVILTISPEAKYIIIGSGYGHGLGVCMHGANQLGRLGKTAEEILKHYYTGVEIKPLWECKTWLADLQSLVTKDGKPAEN